MIPIKRNRIELLPKQLLLIRSEEDEVLYSGAFGAGKTRGLCYKALTHAIHSGNLVGLCRKTLASLKQTTLRVLLKPDGDLPPVLPEGTYTHNKQECLITLNDGGEIYYFGFDDPLRAASLNLGAVCVDEGVELDEDEYTMLLGRLRNTADPCRQIVTVTNPGAPTHFLNKRFRIKPEPNTRIIEANSTENYLLPADYIERLKRFTGQYRDRYVLGKWIAFEGLIYDNFTREIHLRHRRRSAFKYLIVGADEGYEDPAVLSLWAVDGDGRIHLLKVFYRRKVLQRDLVKIAVGFGADLKLDRVFVCDPAAAGLKAALEDAGLDVGETDNSVWEGIQETRNRLEEADDGRPRITFEPNCDGLEYALTEMDSYHIGKDEKPAKDCLDHFVDTMRYVVMHLHSSSAPQIHVIEELEDKKAAHEERHSEYGISGEDSSDDVSFDKLMQREEAWH